eukprot:m51a1_g5896 hypothetical protein (73) ;mRNA; r:542369-543695
MLGMEPCCSALVIAAATHSRLGRDSPAALLPQDLLAAIVQLAGHKADRGSSLMGILDSIVQLAGHKAAAIAQ